MALKLKLHWREEPLQVIHREIEKIREAEADSPHVQTEGDDVLVEDFFRVKNKVLDVSRYRIGERGCIIPHPDISGLALRDELRNQNGSIVLLVESPHKDEYQPGNINCPRAPAKGRTGNNISRCLETVLSRIEEQSLIVPGRHVVISNPIQFQTSLHAIHGGPLGDYTWTALRDNVWLTLWKDKRIQQSFRARLKRYKPRLIINACTGKRTESNSLTAHVEGSVCTVLQSVCELHNAHLYNVGHPRSWTRNDCSHISLEPIYTPDIHNAE